METDDVSLEDADEETEATLRRVRRLSHLLDDAYELPVVGYRVGWDPVVGLLPVVGDLPASAASVYIILEAAYLGVPRATLARMVGRVAVDTVVGSIPLVGPAFDAVWKANARNVALLEDRLEDPTAARSDRRTLALVGVVLVAVLVGLTVAAGAAAAWLLGRAALL